MIEFNSQICTSVEQSKRLLELGLKPETADCTLAIINERPVAFIGQTKIDCSKITFNGEEIEKKEIVHYPAWSLHRLIEIVEVSVEVSGLFIRISSTYYYEEKDNVYDNLIDAISELINNEVFNKEYLKQ